MTWPHLQRATFSWHESTRYCDVYTLAPCFRSCEQGSGFRKLHLDPFGIMFLADGFRCLADCWGPVAGDFKPGRLQTSVRADNKRRELAAVIFLRYKWRIDQTIWCFLAKRIPCEFTVAITTTDGFALGRSHQHLRTPFFAVWNTPPMVRASNTGVHTVLYTNCGRCHRKNCRNDTQAYVFTPRGTHSRCKVRC